MQQNVNQYRQSISSTDSSQLRCRICFESNRAGELIRACNCTGSIGLVHTACLSTWLNQSKKVECELCGFKYPVIVEYPSFQTWLCEETDRALSPTCRGFSCTILTLGALSMFIVVYMFIPGKPKDISFWGPVVVCALIALLISVPGVILNIRRWRLWRVLRAKSTALIHTRKGSDACSADSLSPEDYQPMQTNVSQPVNLSEPYPNCEHILRKEHIPQQTTTEPAILPCTIPETVTHSAPESTCSVSAHPGLPISHVKHTNYSDDQT